MHGAQMSELKHKPWVEKDWMQWTVWDCQNTLNYSPWVYVNRGLGRETGPTIYAQDAFEFYPKTTIEFTSALPFRLATLRKLQLDHHYDGMNAQKKQSFDLQHANDMAETDSRPVQIYFGSTYFAPLATRPGHPPGVGGAPPPTQLALRLSDGTLVMPTEIDLFSGTTQDPSPGWALMYTFPRNVNGRALYSPEEKKISIVLGDTLQFKFDKKHIRMGAQDPKNFHLLTIKGVDSIDFLIADMIYKGKLEY